MAIYHFSAKVISRGKGQSAVASAAYRSGEKMKDERTDEMKFYRRDVQPENMILSPQNAPEWVNDRERLWNEVEKIEKNHNSQLAREIKIALPKELSHDQQKQLIKDYAQQQFVDQGMVADVAIHRDDPENPHAHVMLTIRPFEKNGEWQEHKSKKEYLKDKNGNYLYNKNGNIRTRKIDLTGWNQKEALEQWREQWAEHANRTLEKEGVNDRISHLSNEDRSLETLPTRHLGHTVHEMEKRGVRTEKGDYNREVQEYNKTVVDLKKYREEKMRLQQQQKQQEKQPEKQQEKPQDLSQHVTPQEMRQVMDLNEVIDRSKNDTFKSISERRQQLSHSEKGLAEKESTFRTKTNQFKEAQSHFDSQDLIQSKIDRYQNQKDNINWYNPLKIKENRATNKNADLNIKQLEKDFNRHDWKLDDYREKLQFTDQQGFRQQYQKFEHKKDDTMKDIRAKQATIKEERKTLDQGEQAVKRIQTRKFIAESHPELSHLKEHMKFEEVGRLHSIDVSAGRAVPIEEMKAEITDRNAYIKGETAKLEAGRALQSKVEKVEYHAAQFNEYQGEIDKIENHPFKNGKIKTEQKREGTMFEKKKPSKLKQDYDKLLEQRDSHEEVLNKNGVTTQEDIQQLKRNLNDFQKKEPSIKENIEIGKTFNEKTSLKDLEKGIDGVKQAEQRKEREQRIKERPKVKERDRGLELEM